MARFANLFLYDIDFARDIQAGDRFEAVYEVFFDAEGAPAGTGDILFAGMSWQGNRHAKGYYRFDDAEDMELPFFDAAGESASRLLMKTPIEGARITSSFGMRRHPLLGYNKQHKGVDFGARQGTPIMAAGDGIIVKAGAQGSYGNYVRIEHSGGYETAYAHLHGFGKGIKRGARVRQGDIIGYVGSTGRSTGPHLHYEVMKNGEVQNPMTIEVANGRMLDGELKDAFDERRLFVDTVRIHPLTVADATDR
jgi:murein DD-endopeptidase MepM/ murein hydrolase activator NlpD